MKTAIFLYETGHLAHLDAAEHGAERPVIVSLDAEIDYALEKKGVAFVSGHTFDDRTTTESLLRAETIVNAMCESEALARATYRSVSLIEPLRFSLHIYLIDLLYYLRLIRAFSDRHADISHFSIPVSSQTVLKTSGPLARELSATVFTAARLVAESRGFSCVALAAPRIVRAKNSWHGTVFALKRALFGAGLSLLNIAQSIRPRRPLRIVASDYWRNIAPVLRELPEAELVLIDRTEAFKAGLKNIWQHKMRFAHLGGYVSWKGGRRACAAARAAAVLWEKEKTPELSFDGIGIGAHLNEVLTRLMREAVPSIARDIEGAFGLFRRLAPDAVELRVSISTQRHFVILPLVARILSVPAVELQHGIEYLGPGSATKRHAAQYLAAYGPLVCAEHDALGTGEEAIPVGSPRFDAYVKHLPQRAERGSERCTILSNTPTPSVGERFGTYSVEDYFAVLGNAVRPLTSAALVVTSRSTSVRASFNEESRARGLKGVPYAYAGTTTLAELFSRADVFVCSYSTVVYEALLNRVPTVLAAFAPVEGMMADYHFKRFADAGALRIAHSPEELAQHLSELSSDAEKRRCMSESGWAFMQREFSFDGDAGKKIADRFRQWGTKRDSTAAKAYSR